MHQQGFSLIELLMGLAIAAIVLSWAGAGYYEIIEANARKDAALLLISGLRSARGEAIARNQTVIVKALDDDWSKGWRIVLDDDEQTLLMERTSHARVAGNRPVRRLVKFSRLGAPLLTGGGFRAGTLHVCAKRKPVSHHQVVLAPSGRVRLQSVEAVEALCESGLKQRANAQFLGHGERDVLLASGQFIGTGGTPGLQLLDHTSHQHFRR